MPIISLQSYAEGVALDSLPTNVANNGPNTVYYGNDSTVSPSNNIGSIASGANQSFNAPTYLYGPGSTVTVSSLQKKNDPDTGVAGDIPNVTGAKGGNVALGSLLSALVSLGIVQDSTSA